MVCPRCHGPIESHGPVVLAAGSRATPERDIDICAPCGADEVHNLVRVAQWPVSRQVVR